MSQILTGLVRSIRYAKTDRDLMFFTGYALGYVNPKYAIDALMHERFEALVYNAKFYRGVELEQNELPRMMRKQAA